MKLNWGTGIAATLVLFVGMMAWFAVRAMNNQAELVTENYYEQELTYQRDIDRMSRSLRPEERVMITTENGGIRLHFPENAQGKRVEGRLFLMRPSDLKADRTVDVTPDSNGVAWIPAGDLRQGNYEARLDWSADGDARLQEERIQVR